MPDKPSDETPPDEAASGESDGDQPLRWPPSAQDDGADETDEVAIDYPAVVQESLRDVPRRVLAQVARDGLAGAHHLYISFKTRADGVSLPPFLLDLHPEEMTIVLENQFWDLAVDREAFSVTLSFSRNPHTLRVPFAALTTFVDPSVPFGLRWEGAAQEEGENAAVTEEAVPPAERVEGGEAVPEAAETAEDEPDGNPAEPGKVLRLDRFRPSED